MRRRPPPRRHRARRGDVIVLEEPTGLAARDLEAIMRHAREAIRGTGVRVLVVSHEWHPRIARGGRG